MKVVFFLLLMATMSAFGQELTNQEADSLIHLLNRSKPGLDKIYQLLKMADYQVLKPGEFKADFDTARSYLNEAAALNKQIKSRDADAYWLLVEARLLSESGQKEAGKENIENAIAILERGGNKAHLGKAYYDLSMYFTYTVEEQLKKKISLVEKARDAFQKGGDLTGKGRSLVMLGDLYDLNGEEEKSLEALKMSLAVYDSINYNRVHGIYTLLGRIYAGQRDYKQALFYELKALSIAESLHDSTMQLCQIHNILGDIYSSIGSLDLAIMHCKAALEIALRFDDTFTIASMILKISSMYSDNKQPQKALEFLSSQPKKYMNSENSQLQAVIRLSYFNAYLVDKIEARKKEDSIRLKNQDILVLTQKNNQQYTSLQQAEFVRNVIIAGAALILIILGLLYRQYRLKQKSNGIIMHKNELLQHLLTEKEWLLKEIHHRVKNNLQIVMSILNTQTAFIENDVALTAIHNSQHRVQSMSLIHQKLYNSENLSTIDVPSYIRELVSYLSDSFNTAQQIRFEFNTDPLQLDVSQAVPLGLILNEAITNSIKYAFPGEMKGLIVISISNTFEKNYLLSIKDNGIGMPADFNNKKRGSLGMNLMSGLSEDLGGKFSIENNNGTIIRISFAHELPDRHTDLFTQPLIEMQ